MSTTESLDSTRRRATASLIGGVGGAAYVVINSSALGEPAAVPLRAVAILTLVWVVYRAWTWRSRSPGTRRRQGFGRSYWVVVAVEAVLIFGGRALILTWLDEESYFLPWLSLVVGVHFFAFARIWHRWAYVWLGLLVSASAVAAGVLVAVGAGTAVVTVFDAIVPGAGLLVFAALLVPSPRRRAPEAEAQRPAGADPRVHDSQRGRR